jgi:hypothetical protein
MRKLRSTSPCIGVTAPLMPKPVFHVAKSAPLTMPFGVKSRAELMAYFIKRRPD